MRIRFFSKFEFFKTFKISIFGKIENFDHLNYKIPIKDVQCQTSYAMLGTFRRPSSAGEEQQQTKKLKKLNFVAS